jgi:hypothetical protein
MTARRIRTSPIVWIGLGLLALLLVAACKSDAQLEAEREADEATSVPTATAATETTATPTPAATAVATTSEPAVRYVANTGGSGVSLRSACRVDARIAGAWAEGTRVEVVQVGSGSCDGWTLAASGSTETWVDNRYLGDTAATVATRPGGSTSTGGTPTGGSTGTSPTPTATTAPPAASAAPGQFSIERWWFTEGSIGQKVLHLTIHNDSAEALDQYQIDICMIDAQGHQIKEHGYGFSCFRFSDLQVHVPAGASYTPDREWSLHAYEGLNSVLITPVFSHTTADHFWRP